MIPVDVETYTLTGLVCTHIRCYLSLEINRLLLLLLIIERGREGGHGGEEQELCDLLVSKPRVDMCFDKDNTKRVCGLDGCVSHHHPSLHGAKDPQVANCSVTTLSLESIGWDVGARRISRTSSEYAEYDGEREWPA